MPPPPGPVIPAHIQHAYEEARASLGVSASDLSSRRINQSLQLARAKLICLLLSLGVSLDEASHIMGFSDRGRARRIHRSLASDPVVLAYLHSPR